MKKFMLVVAFCVALCGAAAAEEADDVLGESRDGVYTNKVMGAEAKFGKDWKIFSRNEIAAIGGAVSSTSPTAKEMLEKSMTFFLAATLDGTRNINITADEINTMGKALIVESKDLFVEMHMNMAMEGMRSANSANDLEDFVVERDSVNFLDEQRPAVRMTGTYRKIPMYQKQVMFLAENYILNITATSVGKDRTDEMLSMFHKTAGN